MKEFMLETSLLDHEKEYAFLEQYQREITSTIVSSFDLYQSLIPEDHRSNISIYLSYLRSGVLCGTPWFRMDLCRDEGLVKGVIYSTCWDLPFLKHKIDNDFPFPEPYSLKSQQVEPYIVEESRLKSSELYFCALGQLLSKTFEDVELLMYDNYIPIYYGEYFGRYELL